MPNDNSSAGADNIVLYVVIAVLAVLLVAAIAAVVFFAVKKKGKIKHGKRHGKRGLKQENIPITVGKLHAQGARSSQQDCFAVSPTELFFTNGMLAAVADGMGGLADGDKVSQAAVSAMFDNFLSYNGEKEGLLLYLAEMANQSVNALLGTSRIGGSGSTLVAGWINEKSFYYISVGDSRICLYRQGQLIQLNREHIYLHELSIEAVNGRGSFQAAAANPQKSGLTSYLGMGSLKYIDIPAEPVAIQDGDTFVLMSDGVYNALSAEEISSALSLGAAEAAEKMEAMISEKAYEKQDNYTAVIIRYGE